MLQIDRMTLIREIQQTLTRGVAEDPAGRRKAPDEESEARGARSAPPLTFWG